MGDTVLYQKCPHCNGTGEYSPASGVNGQTFTCNWLDCNGTGFITFGKIGFDLTDIKDKLDDIWEKLNE